MKTVGVENGTEFTVKSNKKKRVSIVTRPSYLSFTLPDSFVDTYKDKRPPFGFTDAAGTSLGEITFARTYSHKKDDGTKEQWYEVVRRVVEGTYSLQKDYCLANRLPWNGQKALASAKNMFDKFFYLKSTPPGRGLSQMGRELVNKHKISSPLQNCSNISTSEMTKYDPAKPFVFMLQASSLGIGVGFDVRGADKNFKIHKPNTSTTETFVIPDSREGWAEALRLRINSYLIEGKSAVEFDYSGVRPAGSEIKTFGGTASGPEPLREVLDGIAKIFDTTESETVTVRHIADIMNMIGKCIVAGGARRSAQLMMGSIEDEGYLDFKNYEANPERASYGWASNNSVDVSVGDDLTPIIEGIARNGEPGVLWMDTTRKYGRLKDAPDNKDWRVSGYNPCCVSASTSVMTSEGPRRIDSLAGRPFTAIVDGKPYTSKTGAFVSGEKVVYKLSTKEGFSVEVTADHKIKKSDGTWVEASELSKGDEITLHNHSTLEWGDPTQFGNGYLMGLFVGDGNFGSASTNGTRVAHVKVWESDNPNSIKEAAYEFAKTLPHRSDWGGWNRVSSRAYSQMSIGTLPASYGMVDTLSKHNIDLLEEESSSFYKGFLSGLFDADGHVEGWNNDKGFSVRLGQAGYDFMQVVQRMLLRLGIKSSIHSLREEGLNTLPDGKGGLKDYHCKETFRLIIGANHAKKFVDEIGFIHTDKARKAEEHFSNRKRFYKKPFTATVESLTEIGEQEVWDITVEDVHAFDANGVFVHNCEQPLESMEMCTLSCVFLNNATSKEDFLETLKYAYLYAKTVTLLPTQWDETNSVMQRNRRIGVSLGGIADFVDNFGLPTLREWMDEGYEELRRLDKTYSEWLCVRESIRISTVKPDGSVGLLAGTSPGVHWTPGGKFFIRRITLQNTDPLVAQFKRAGYNVVTSYYSPESAVVVELPIKSDAKRSEAEVSIFEKANLAAELQYYWSDNAVSVTVSFDPEKEFEDVGKILHMYEGKLKTVSFLPMGGKYEQMPYEPITEDQYEEMRANLDTVDLSPIYGLEAEEVEDEKFCVSDVCEIKDMALQNESIPNLEEALD